MNYICTTKNTFISYLSCCFDQVPNKKQHEERKSYPASQLGGSLPWRGRHRGRSKRLVLHIAPSVRKHGVERGVRPNLSNLKAHSQ